MANPKSADVIKLFMDVQPGSVFVSPTTYIPVNVGGTNTPNVEVLGRNVVTGTGSKLAPVMGRRFNDLSFSHEIVGSDYSASEVPFVDPVLQGVGMVGAFGFAIPATVTANIEFNTEIEGVTSGATANVTIPARIGDTLIYVDSIVGTFDVGGENLEVSTSAVGASSGAIEQQSREYTYVANADQKRLCTRLEEDLQKTESYEANLTLVIEAGASQIAAANFTYQGKFNQDGGKDVYMRDIVSMTDTSSYVDKQPPVFDCARFEIDGVQDLVPSGTFTLDFAATLAVRPDVNQCDGMKGVFIPERAPTFTFRAEQMANTQWEYYESMVGAVVSPSYWRYGDTQYNTAHFIMPAFKITGVSPSEENLIKYVEISGVLTGTDNDDLKVLLT